MPSLLTSAASNSSVAAKRISTGEFRVKNISFAAFNCTHLDCLLIFFAEFSQPGCCQVKTKNVCLSMSTNPGNHYFILRSSLAAGLNVAREEAEEEGDDIKVIPFGFV